MTKVMTDVCVVGGNSCLTMLLVVLPLSSVFVSIDYENGQMLGPNFRGCFHMWHGSYGRLTPMLRKASRSGQRSP